MTTTTPPTRRVGDYGDRFETSRKGTTMNVRDKFGTMRKDMSTSLIERDGEIDLCLTGLLSQENVLLVSTPGTAKSLLANTLVKWIGKNGFRHLLSKFSTPEDIFGPISVVGLKEDRYRRIVTGMLPEASVCFLDEIWKASTAILNTLLTIVNERQYDNGGQRIDCPLKLCIAASNEWPSSEDGQELNALFDRFLFRKTVQPIATAAGLERLIWTPDHTPTLSTSITPAEIDEAHAEVVKLPWSDEAKEAFREIVQECRVEGIVPSDRRLHLSPKVGQAFAYLSGANSVKPDHLKIFAHVLWVDPEEQPRKVAEIVGKIANPIGLKINSLLMEAEEILGTVNVKNTQNALTACKKLSSIAKSFRSMNGNGRAEKAHQYVAGEVKRIKIETVEVLS